jgi:hypothetical protein
MKNLPPKKHPGQGCGHRTINGTALDVRGAAAFLGTTEKTLRGLIGRQLIPFRRLNSRIILLRNELESFLADLPGCTPEQARANQEARR